MGSPSGEQTVLIIDDNLQLLDLVAKSLSLVGNYAVITADNGATGLEKFVEHRPDCVVIDVRMPGLDGYQLVRAIRGDPTMATTPLVILTAMAQDRDRYAGLAAGADQYLLKPIEPLTLVAAIQQALLMSDTERQQRLQALAEAPPEDVP